MYKTYVPKDVRSPDVILTQYFPIFVEYVLFMSDDDFMTDKSYEGIINRLIKSKLKQIKE